MTAIYSMITLLLPIANYSFFARACIHNVFETCGATDQLDFAFLTSAHPPFCVTTEFERLKSQGLKFRVIRAPWDTNLHLDLLDWAVKRADMTDWFITQHCDLIWLEQGWLNRVLDAINEHPNDIAFSCFPKDHTYRLDGQYINVFHDYFGIYNRKLLSKHGLSFQWGHWKELEYKLSPEVVEAVNTKRLFWKSVHQPYPENYRKVLARRFIDGSRMIQLELSVRFPDLTHHINFAGSCDHVWQVFRIANKTQVDGDRLVCRHFNDILQLFNSSYVTSFLIDKDELGSQHVPFGVLYKIWAVPSKIPSGRYKAILPYAAKNVLGYDDLGIKRARFYDLEVDLNDIPSYVREISDHDFEKSVSRKKLTQVAPRFASTILKPEIKSPYLFV